MESRRLTHVVALLVFLAAAAVYFITLTPTTPFWDSGEFIGVSYILGVPHPPGTPFYVLLGRIATLVPLGSIAQRVNGLSALAAALAVLFTYLSALRLVRLAQGPTRRAGDEWVAQLGGVVAALMIAWSDSFWENSIEAEVYSLMSFAQILVFWLGLVWWEGHQERPRVGPLLLATFVMWVSVGLHLGVAVMSLPLLALLFLVDRRVLLVFLVPFATSLLVTMGLERLAGGVLALSSLTFLVFAYRRELSGGIVAAGCAASLVGLYVAMGDSDFTPLTAAIAVLGVAVPLFALARRHREGRILVLAMLLMVIGYSTHLYLPIRAAQHPAINEGAPATWDSLRDLLERKQYGEMNMFVRRGRFVETQLNKEFWRYFSRQWPLFPQERPWASAVPLLLGVAGAAWQFRREKVSFLSTFIFVGITTAGMIAFLNFSDAEVRERDYFFQSGYHAFALWIGLGAAWLTGWVRDSFAEGPARRWATVGTGVLLAVMPFLMLKQLWYTHDRRGNYVARDYAYNMLAPLAPNSYIFTNGDNDTFPLWYIQQVEGVRRDVRVVNLSLLNTDWYIFQLRDEEPRVPITLDDATIRQLGRGAVVDQQGRIRYTNEIMVGHILEQTRNPDGSWKKQPYFAVTVPEHYGLDKYFTLEGLANRVNPDSTGPEIDVPLTRKNLYEVFQYRGLFKPDGSWDASVYKDENASTLSRNFVAAHLQLAFQYRREGQLALAIAEMERVGRMFPDYVDVQLPLGSFYVEAGDTAKAMALYQKLAGMAPDNPEARYYCGVAFVFQGRLDEAMREMDAAIALDPNYNMPYYAAYSALWEAGQRERALGYIQRWVSAHPNDDQARALLETQRGLLGLAPPAPTIARPPLTVGP